MTIIGQRPPEVETNAEAGHWEGDLILGTGAASAMVTLRERKTQFGIIINLPTDHTAATTSAAPASCMCGVLIMRVLFSSAMRCPKEAQRYAAH